MVGTGAKGYLNRLNLTGAILMVIQLGLQNFFIIEGLHREPFHEVHPAPTIVPNPYVLQPSKELSGSLEGSDTKDSPVLTGQSLHGHAAEHRPKLLWKRRVLKEVCAFLLLGNVIVSTILPHTHTQIHLFKSHKYSICPLISSVDSYGSCQHSARAPSLTTALNLISIHSTCGLLL